MRRRAGMASRARWRGARVRLSCVVVAALLVLGLLGRGRKQEPRHEARPIKVAHPLPSAHVDAPRDVGELLTKLAGRAREAANGSEVFTSAEQALWRTAHPCASRYEIHALYALRRSVEANPKWSAVLREYAALHRTCVRRMGDVSEFFLRRRHVAGCQFVVAGVSAGSGIGNKALSIAAALLYAVLTQRVLLVPLATAVPGVFCEPFEGSSWMVDPEQVWAESKKRPDLWESVESFHRKVDSRGPAHPTIKAIYAMSATEDWDAQPHPRFFCDTEQSHYERAEWINFRNNLYFVPKLFAVLSFRPVLEDLFPDRRVFTHVLRTVLLPCDPVWGRVKQVHDSHLRHADRRVGIQERYFHGRADFDLLHLATEDHVARCLVSQRLLPGLWQGPALESFPNPLRVTTILIASLYQSLAARLTRDYVRSYLGTGDAVGVVQLSHEGTQQFGVEVDQQAVAETLCLSLSDHLILTPQSTFGALAQGYGGLVPWLIDLRPDTPTPCVRALSSEPCFQIPASKSYICPHDVAVNGRLMTEVVPYLSDCHSVETPFVPVHSAGLGMLLLTTTTNRTQPVAHIPVFR